MSFDTDSLSKDYTEAILDRSEGIESQLISAGMDSGFARLMSIQALYSSLKQLVAELGDRDSQEKIYKVIEYDARNIVSVVEPNVAYTGKA